MSSSSRCPAFFVMWLSKRVVTILALGISQRFFRLRLMANFNTPYNVERDGQIEFFDNFGIPYDEDNSVLVDYTDGVFNGNILEFKKDIPNTNEVLFQAIKYLSRMRVHGESVPATIILIDLNSTLAYVFHSSDFRKEIHKIYIGASSKKNKGFFSNATAEKLNYSIDAESARLKKILKGTKKNPEEMYIPIDIDENCIVGWSERYYKELPNASKGDFIGDTNGTAIKLTGEIRKPRHFEGLITPYKGKSNERFKFLMDCLNDRLSKKELGAYYTPVIYARQAAEFVMEAIRRVPEGNDYIILDRSAGTGNLEASLIGLKDAKGDDIIKHCVVSTYEYYEYKVLQERIGDLVKEIIPPTEANVIYSNGKVSNADATSEDFIKNPTISEFLDDENCSIILFENPPFQDSSAITFVEDGNPSKRAQTTRKDSFVSKEFKKEIVELGLGGQQAVARDIMNLFIWSAFKYYLRQPTDSYILFSPVKYYKNIHLVDKRFMGGYAFNRDHFHASPSVISCIYWSNEDKPKSESILLQTYDIDTYKNAIVREEEHDLQVPKVYNNISDLSDKREDSTDIESITSIAVVGADGYEKKDWVYSKGRKPKYNDNIIAYMVSKSFMIDSKQYNLVRTNFDTGLKNSYGFWLRKDNFLEKLPMFVAKLLPMDKWYEKEVYFTTSDKGAAYVHDRNFLKTCLIYTCLSNQNKCVSFYGSDERYYRNELCFDYGTLASETLNEFELDSDEENLMYLWRKILSEAHTTNNYNNVYSYGVYQISEELNTFQIEGTGRNKHKVYDYVDLNGDLNSLRENLKTYYRSHILDKMFKYELVK